MANKVIGDYTAAATIDGANHYLLIQPGGASTAYNKINRNVFLGVTGQPMDISTAQNVTNKTLNNTNIITIRSDRFTLQDSADTTKQAVFSISGLTTATTRTYSLPDATTMLVGTATTQTLTNKTLTSPTITGGTYDNGTITVDSIGGHTSANIVTVAGLQINNGVLNSNNSVVTANIADAAVTPAKLQTGTGSGWSWQTYTPTLGNLTLGNGTVVGKFIQTGKTINGFFSFALGSTSTVGSSPTFTLPVSARSFSAIGTGSVIIGNSWYDHTGVSNALGCAVLSGGNTTVATLVVTNVSATYPTIAGLSSTVPFTWSVGDAIIVFYSYEAA